MTTNLPTPKPAAQVPAPPDPAPDMAGVERNFADGQTVFVEGQLSDFAYRIVSGRVELTKASADGVLRLATLGVGELFGEMGLLDGSVRSATARAAGPVVLRALDREQLFALIQSRPDSALALARTVAQRLRQANNLIAAPELAAPRPARPSLLIRLFRPRQLMLSRVRIEFQPDAIEIEERPMPWAARAILYDILGPVVTGCLWASLASIDRLVLATGKLVTTASKIVIQPRETAIIRAIKVQVGQVVQRGDVLVSLDPTFANADERSVRAQMVGSAAAIKRLEAELADTRPKRFSDNDAENANQTEVFRRWLSERDTMLRSFDEQIKELQSRQVSLGADTANVKAQLEIGLRLERLRQKLLDDGNGSLVNLLDAQREVASAKRELGRLANEATETVQKIATVRGRREADLSESLSRAAQALETARKEFSQIAELLKKQERISDLIEMRSPAKAMVIDLGTRSIGSVIREGEAVATLVELDVPIEVDITIEPRDISHLRVGDLARIKLDAFPYQKYGTLDGKIKSINGDVVEEEFEGRRAKVYKARVEITYNNLRDVPKDMALIPGMSATCEIKVGTRRLITYFLYPIIRTLDSGLREP
ncbi:MAG: HlyD family type I secretion periplasmic adaptor subunit [Alphaproteobacteria bacterium]|nr:HlyD family type I secretion periplasmic adaptor subunit [Alphaproteobacteria bacterium]